MEQGSGFEDGAGLCFSFFSPLPTPQAGEDVAGHDSTMVSLVGWFWGEEDHLDLGYQPGPWLIYIFCKASIY